MAKNKVLGVNSIVQERFIVAELEWFPDPGETRKQAIDRVPLKRFATASEVADAILFFSTDATYATGSIFSLDGGTTAI